MKDKNTRRILRLSKFAFPRVNTGTTRVQNPEQAENIKITRWERIGKRRSVTVKWGYSEESDILFVERNSFLYERDSTAPGALSREREHRERVYYCKTCGNYWDKYFEWDDPTCYICKTICENVTDTEKGKRVLAVRNKPKSSKQQVLDEFLNDESASDTTLEARRNCDAEGHLPYVNGGQGNDGMIHGCYCGWIQIKPISVPEPSSWSDL